MKNYFPVVAARRAASASLICAICVICGLSSALEISNSTNTPTTNSAAIYATLTNVIVATTATCYYGTTDGGTSAAAWAYSTNYADCTNGEITVTVTNLVPATWYFYRWYAADPNTNAWASTSSNLITLARAPTNYPTPGTGVTVIADTNGLLLAPTNFFGANGVADSNTLNALQGAIATNAGNIQTNADNFTAHTNNVDNPHGVTPTQIGALAASSNLLDVADADAARSNLGAAAQADLEQIISQTNQVIDVNGVKYIITNAPASAGDVLVFDPASTTAYFSAQSGGGGLTLDEVKDASPLMTNIQEIAIGKQASAGNDTVAIGYLSQIGNGSVSVGYDSGSPSYIFSVNLGYQAKGRSRSVLSGYRTSGEEYSTVIGYYAKSTNNSAALGALVTNPVPGTTRVRGDLYLDGGNRIYVRSAFNSGEFTELAAGGAAAGTYPVFAVPLGGAWTDFEIKASTNNFTDLVYYYKSWTNVQDATRGDTNALCYFTDDHAADVRVWNIKTQTNAISEMLTSTNSEVETVYFYPSHDCTIPWSEWMAATNTALVWSYVRVDDLGFEMNASGTKQHWSPIRPDSWDAALTEP